MVANCATHHILSMPIKPQTSRIHIRPTRKVWCKMNRLKTVSIEFLIESFDLIFLAKAG